MNLTTLPLLPLEKIASYLDFSSLVSLAASTSSLAHLQPKEQLVKGEDFSLCEVYIRLKGKTPYMEQRRFLLKTITLTWRSKPEACWVSSWLGNGQSR